MRKDHRKNDSQETPHVKRKSDPKTALIIVFSYRQPEEWKLTASQEGQMTVHISTKE